jgi:hypothetical protein
MRATTRTRAGRWTVLRAVAGLAALGLGPGACAVPAPAAIPAELPNRTDQGEFHLRWALLREPDLVRAVGRAETGRVVAWATLGLLGVDRDGRVVSQGRTDLSGSFGRTTQPFEIRLRPTGREARFELVLLQAQEGKPGE